MSSLCVVAGMRFHLPWNASLPHRRQAHQPEFRVHAADESRRGEGVSIPPLPPPWPTDPVADPVWIAKADSESLRAAVTQLSTKVSRLEWEKAALEFAAESFGALAERLNIALRAIREAPPS
jgi:hypothetical protein